VAFTTPRTLLINRVRVSTRLSRMCSSVKSICAASARCWTGDNEFGAARTICAKVRASRLSLFALLFAINSSCRASATLTS